MRKSDFCSGGQIAGCWLLVCLMWVTDESEIKKPFIAERFFCEICHFMLKAENDGEQIIFKKLKLLNIN